MPRDLKTAQAELDEARAVLATLEEQVREGDDVTPQQLTAQRELITFAELRVEAAVRTEQRMLEGQRAELAETAKTAATSLLTGDTMAALADATRAAVDAVAHVVSLADQRNAKIEQIGATLTGIDEDLKRHQGIEQWGSQQYGVWGNRDRVIVPGVGAAGQMDVGALTASVVAMALTGSAEGQQAAASHRGHTNGLVNLTVRRLLESYPELGEALRATPEKFAAVNQRGRADLAEQGRRPLPEAVEG